MTKSKIILSEDSRVKSEAIFADMFSVCSGITGTLISSVDGHFITGRFDAGLEQDRLAAMLSSLLALGESIARECNHRLCDHVIVENELGYVLTRRLGRRLVLTTLANRNSNLGLVNAVSHGACEKFSSLILNKQH